MSDLQNVPKRHGYYPLCPECESPLLEQDGDFQCTGSESHRWELYAERVDDE